MKESLEEPGLTKDQKAHRLQLLREAKKRAAKKEPEFFIDEFCWLKPPTGGKIPFLLWAAQRRVLEVMCKHLQVIILKARRLGLSWLVLAYALWLAFFRDNCYIPIFSTGEKAAGRHIGRVKFMYQNLPEWLKADNPLVRDSIMSLEFKNGSILEAFADTENAARGEGATLAVVDEHAWQSWARQNWPAIKPIIDGGGQMVIVSTAKTKADLFADLWAKAKRGLNKFIAVFLPYDARPDRDEAWWESEKNEYPDEALFYREYPRTEADAFRSPEGQFFDSWDGMAHILKVPYKPHPNWPVYVAVDFGYNYPAVLWIQEDPVGRIYIFAELLPSKVTTAELAEMIKLKKVELGIEKIAGYFCDPAGKAKTAATGESEIAIMRSLGITMTSITSGVKDGCDLIRVKLKENLIFVCPTCSRVIQAFEDLVRDVDKAGNLRSENYIKDGINDHPMDGFRYYMVNRWLQPAGDAPETSEGRESRPITAGLRGKVF